MKTFCGPANGGSGGLALFEIPGRDELVHGSPDSVDAMAHHDTDLTVLALGPEIGHVSAHPAGRPKNRQPLQFGLAGAVNFVQELLGRRRKADPAQKHPAAPGDSAIQCAENGNYCREGVKRHDLILVFGRADGKRALAVAPAGTERLWLVECETDWAFFVAERNGIRRSYWAVCMHE